MQVVVSVKFVKVFDNEEFANVQLTLDKPIKGFRTNPDTEIMEETDVTTISFGRSKLTSQLCDLNEDIAWYRAGLDASFGQKEFGRILFNAKLTLNRELKAAGEEVNGKVLERDSYITDIVGVKLSERSVKFLNEN